MFSITFEIAFKKIILKIGSVYRSMRVRKIQLYSELSKVTKLRVIT